MSQQPNLVNKSYHGNVHPLVKYCADKTVNLHPMQKKLLDKTLAGPRAGMVGAPEVVQFNMHLIKVLKAKRMLEIGFFTGFNALSCALVLPEDGQVVGADITDKYWINGGGKEIAQEAGVLSKIDLRVDAEGGALKILDDLIANGESGKFDFAFIDADKPNHPAYYEKCLQLVRPYGAICADNALWSGAVVDSEKLKNDENTIGLDRLNTIMHEDGRVWNSLFNSGDGLHVAFVKPKEEIGKFP